MVKTTHPDIIIDDKWGSATLMLEDGGFGGGEETYYWHKIIEI